MTYKEVSAYRTTSYGTVYLLTNSITGKQYVGQTVQKLIDRIKAHKWHGKQESPKTAIHRSIKKHGFENFIIEVLGHYDTQGTLDAAERDFAYSLKTFTPNGYNMLAGAGVGAASDELKAKLSALGTGRKYGVETREKQSIIRADWHATKSPEVETERRRKLSEAHGETYVFRSPSGERVEITNLKRWCEENGFTKTQWCKMALVAVGKDRSVKGWSLWNEPGQQPLSKFRGIGYTLRSPSGEKVFVSTTLKEWCVAQGFTDAGWAAMRKVTSGARKEYQGWSVWKD